MRIVKYIYICMLHKVTVECVTQLLFFNYCFCDFDIIAGYPLNATARIAALNNTQGYFYIYMSVYRE